MVVEFNWANSFISTPSLSLQQPRANQKSLQVRRHMEKKEAITYYSGFIVDIIR